jgi:signal transduction histidine kinase
LPLLALHAAHEGDDIQRVSIMLTFWIATALVYPSLHRFAVWLVDKIILRRADYAKLRVEISKKIEQCNSVEEVLNETCRKLVAALTARKSDWQQVSENDANLPTVVYTLHRAEIFVPVAESPFYEIHLNDFAGGRRLLSDEIEMLEAVALLSARRVDALRVTHERCEREIREQEFSKLATEAQLTALRAQINPHFLFNALTTIGYLIQTAPDKAFATLMKLTALLRRVLKSSGEFSTLGEEIELVESYLEIERARFEERLRIEIEAPRDLRNLRVPALILQPLVENAVKHGISRAKRGGAIKISARLENEKDAVYLKLNVSDSGAGANSDELRQNRRKGLGLNNIEHRLRSYYGAAAVLKIKSETGKGTSAEIRLPVSNSALIK